MRTETKIAETIEEIKRVKRLNSDADLAGLLHIRPSTVSAWRSEKPLNPTEAASLCALFSFCERERIVVAGGGEEPAAVEVKQVTGPRPATAATESAAEPVDAKKEREPSPAAASSRKGKNLTFAGQPPHTAPTAKEAPAPHSSGTVRDRIRFVFDQTGYSEGAFASRIGAAESMVARLLNRKPLTVPTLHKIAGQVVAEFGVDPNWLRGGVGDPPKLEPCAFPQPSSSGSEKSGENLSSEKKPQHWEDQLERLRSVFQKTGYTQVEFAKKIGVSQATLSVVLNGKWDRFSDMQFLRIIWQTTEAMGVNREWLEYGIGEPPEVVASAVQTEGIPDKEEQPPEKEGQPGEEQPFATVQGRVRYVFKRSGLNQKDFAESLGVGQPHLSGILHNRKPSRRLLMLISQKTGANYRWLLDGSGTTPEEPTQHEDPRELTVAIEEVRKAFFSHQDIDERYMFVGQLIRFCRQNSASDGSKKAA